ARPQVAVDRYPAGWGGAQACLGEDARTANAAGPDQRGVAEALAGRELDVPIVDGLHAGLQPHVDAFSPKLTPDASSEIGREPGEQSVAQLEQDGRRTSGRDLWEPVDQLAGNLDAGVPTAADDDGIVRLASNGLDHALRLHGRLPGAYRERLRFQTGNAMQVRSAAKGDDQHVIRERLTIDRDRLAFEVETVNISLPKLD